MKKKKWITVDLLVLWKTLGKIKIKILCINDQIQFKDISALFFRALIKKVRCIVIIRKRKCSSRETGFNRVA